jgi:TBC1 domain family member 2
MHFTFRWMNCLLMRELPLKHIVRIWDTYLAEGEDFGQFHVYVCAAFLIHWSAQLRMLDFQPLMLFLQRLPTQNWGDKEIDMLLSQAYVVACLPLSCSLSLSLSLSLSVFVCCAYQPIMVIDV